MAYWVKYRKIQAGVREVICESSDESSENISSHSNSNIANTSDHHSSPHISQAEVFEDSTSTFSHYSESSSDSNSSSLDLSVESFSDLSENEADGQQNLRKCLASWAIKYKVPRDGVNEMLHIMRAEGLNLPADSRTLLKTPRVCNLQDKCGGKYIYIGLKTTILKFLSQEPSFVEHHNIDSNIELHINIDGIPLFKSTNEQMWPILARFSGFKPFVVGAYCGQTKPNSNHEFLEDFVNECSNLDRIDYNGKLFNIKLKVFICDAPARAFIKGIKHHTGYFSCERCTIKGEWKGRVVFNSNEMHPKRTDADFNAHKYADHQQNLSPLIQLNFPCVTGVVLDYMHVVCLGVIRRMLHYLKQGSPKCRISFRQIQEISDKLTSFTMPAEFARQPRSLIDLDRWKATEFRQFLLYTGPLALKDIVSDEFYKLFMSLHVGMCVLLNSNNDKRNRLLPYARELLTYFVHKSKHVCGEEFCVYNVHAILHLPDDVQHFGCSLNDISAFPFENHLHKIKKMVRSTVNPLAQVVKRLAELDNIHVSENKFQPRRTRISTLLKDSCFLTKLGKVAFVQVKSHDGLICNVLSSRHTRSLYVYPCTSKNHLNITYITLADYHAKSKRKLLKADDLSEKLVCIRYSAGYSTYPMLHGAECEL